MTSRPPLSPVSGLRGGMSRLLRRLGIGVTPTGDATSAKIQNIETTNTRGHRHDPVTPRPPLDVKDGYFVWHRWANPGHHMQGNVYCYDYAIKHLPSDNPILEIGTFVGLSTNQIAHCK